jgi:membrane protease YdiL (CAAX protease family)
VRRFPVASYFAVVYGVSLVSLVVIGPPSPHPPATQPPSASASLLLFPVMVIMVGVAGVGLAAATGGRAAVSALWHSMRRWRVPPACYAALLIPPLAILVALLALRLLVSPAFVPNLFPVGLLFGVTAGVLEEPGWSGFAYPRLRARLGPLPGAVVLGFLWGLWHLPVVDSLGAASPHGQAWPAFFGAFVLVLTSLRLLICWVYTGSGSLLLAQLLHASSTGFLVVLGAAHTTPAQEATWYACYGLLLALAALAITLRSPATQQADPNLTLLPDAQAMRGNLPQR